MHSFIVSARKYRPKNFSEVRGQTHVVQTLQNAIKVGKIANAFLFCGLKGSGKTTLSRLLAKAINCEKPIDGSEPCNQCSTCTEKVSFHTHELDAASHNSADDMRNLVEQIRYHPVKGKKSVIIIDEAHMLSNAALNVLLKPLEDTPAHVVFILVTTEKHKIIPTVLSRCQVFDFHPIENEAILQQLQEIADKEQIACEAEALDLITEESRGSLRDALSMFDLIVTFSGTKKLTYQAALHHLNLLDENTYLTLTEYLYHEDIGAALKAYDAIVRSGFDGYPFIHGFSQHLRNLLVAKNIDTLALVKVAKKYEKVYQAQAKQIALPFIYEALSLAQTCALQYKNAMQPRLHIEIMLIKIGQLNQTSRKVVSLSQASTIPQPVRPKVLSNAKTPKPVLYPPAQHNVQASFVAEPEPTFTPTPPKKRTIRIPSKLEIEQNLASRSTPTKTTPKHATDATLKEEEVGEHWNVYAARLKKENNLAGYTILKQPIEIKGNQIVLSLVSPMQQGTLHAMQPKLLAYLHQALGNRQITISSKLMPSAIQATAKKPYLDSEKMAALCKENKEMAYLQKKLGLSTLH